MKTPSFLSDWKAEWPVATGNRWFSTYLIRSVSNDKSCAMDHGIDHSTPRGHTPQKGHETHIGLPTIPWFQFLCMLLRPVTRVHIKTSIECNPKALPILTEHSLADAITISKSPSYVRHAMKSQSRFISIFVTLWKAKWFEKLPHSKGPIADCLFPNSLRYLEILSRASWGCWEWKATLFVSTSRCCSNWMTWTPYSILFSHKKKG